MSVMTVPDIARSTVLFLRGLATDITGNATPYLTDLHTYLGGSQYIGTKIYDSWTMPRRAVTVSRRPGFGPTEPVPYAERSNVRIRIYGTTPENIVVIGQLITYSMRPPTGGEGWTAGNTRVVSVTGPTGPGEAIPDPDSKGALFADMFATLQQRYEAV